MPFLFCEYRKIYLASCFVGNFIAVGNFTTEIYNVDRWTLFSSSLGEYRTSEYVHLTNYQN